MLIKQFTFDPKSLDNFVRFGYSIYEGDRKWIPPFYDEMYQQLSSNYPFYNKDYNQHCHFMLYHKDVPVGRITAMINADLKDEDNRPVGTIGFFECKKNYDYARQLLEAALSWLKNNQIRKVWGPMNFDIWHSYRFMTKGFEQNLFYGEPYNPPYYPEFFEQFGFSPKAEWDSVEIADKEILHQMTVKGEKRYQYLLKRGYHFEFADLNNYDFVLEKLHQIMCKSFEGFLGFTPLNVGDLKQLFKKAQHALHPRMFLLAYNEKNELSGFAVALLELADAVRAMKGKSNLAAKLKFSYHRRFVRRVNFYIGGVTPAEVKNRTGLGRAGFYVILNEILKAGFDTMLLTLRLKGNAAHGLPGRLSPDPQREYALYEMKL